jgi:hypothetical protein
MDSGTWCRWRIESELGLRGALPAGGPPPAETLPSPGALIGLSRSALLTALGDPGCGAWKSAPTGGFVFIKAPCAESAHVEYPFSYVPAGEKGGHVLALWFDETGRCASAQWLVYQ